MAKNLFVAYVLWFLLGWLGVHHFYLGRDRQSFVWWATWGGVFGLGWLRDVVRLPEYVDAANREDYYMHRLHELKERRRAPAFSPVRFAGQACFGTFLGYLAKVAVSEDFAADYPYIRSCLAPLAVAVAVHTVGNIGRETCSFLWSLLGACLLPVFLLGDTTYMAYMALLSAILSQRDRGFKADTAYPAGRSLCKRIFILVLAGSLITGMWGSAFYFNASVTTSDGETIRVRDAVDHFFNSPLWKEFKETAGGLFQEAWEQGWQKTWSRFVQALDPEGEQNAYEVLGLSKGASQEEVTKRYRQLVREHHPDKNRHGDPQEIAQRFMRIQTAYETLSRISERRTMRRGESRWAEDI